MSALPYAITVLFLLLGVTLVWLFRRMRKTPPSWDLDGAGRLGAYSAERYRPMEKLLQEQDFESLMRQPGYDARMARRLRAERRRVFRQYLNSLSRDFDHLYAAAKFLILHAPEDRPDLALALFEQRIVFRYALFTIRCRLCLQAMGLGPVDPARLVRAVDRMGKQIRELTAALNPSES